MNEFTEQFILESRDLIEQATATLGALEQDPSDAKSLDALFRAFHTLKGGASIVDFASMERSVHVIENRLAHLRSKKLAVTRKSLADCVACLDLVDRWLDSMEQTGEIPIDAGNNADKLIAEIGDPIERTAKVGPLTRQNSYPDWIEALLERGPEIASRAKTAVRFTPHPDSFLRGEDPLAVVASLPDLLVLDLQPTDTYPTLESLDPFQSFLVITALTAARADQVDDLMRHHVDETAVVALSTEVSRPDALPDSTLSDIGRKILEAQLPLLDKIETQAFAGCVGSAGRVAANVFRRCGQPVLADSLLRATEKSIAERSALYLKDEIASGLLAKGLPSPTLAVPGTSPSLPRSLRVDADRIDEFVRLAGELTVVKNAIGHVVKLALAEENPLATALKNNCSALDRITSELQHTALGMRVLPLRVVLQRFIRVVREMAVDLKKPTNLLIEGGDTEADKAIVEMLFEPLLHLVRNSMDHGIENAATRVARNKPEVATIKLSASRVGDQVDIEIHDDGGGIDVARVRLVAVERGIAMAESVAAMSEADVVDLVFAPGFSTASTVTELSGRGVGMDVVRTAVARMGGKVSLESSYGVGTTVRITLPFSVLITHVMTVEADGQTFGIPLEAVVETISVPAESIAEVGADRAIVHRNRTIPVFDLAGLLRVRDGIRNKSEVLVVIASVAGQLGGIEVDRLGERMEVILKPLDGMLSGIPGITGTTILGDGRVLLVLDLEGVMQ